MRRILFFTISLMILAPRLFAQSSQKSNPKKINFKGALYVCATDNSDGIQWNNNGSNIATGATSSTDGNVNTATIVEKQGDGNYAAHVCDTLTTFGKTDWYLPSKDELDALFQNRAAIGGFTTSYYWSSTENGSSIAGVEGFNKGNQANGDKSNYYRVRCVRRDNLPTPKNTKQTEETVSSKTANTTEAKTQTETQTQIKKEAIETKSQPPANNQKQNANTVDIKQLHVSTIFYNGDSLCIYPLDNSTACSWNDAYTLCDELKAFGRTDWRLPSIGELNAMYLNRQNVQNLNTENGYWSVTSIINSNAWLQYFSDGNQYYDDKLHFYRVRCVRKK